MFILNHGTRIAAPLERVFLLSTSLAIVERELGMHPVAGMCVAPDGRRVALRTEGLALGGDCIRWEGWQVGLPQFHVSLISEYRANAFFQDRMIAGRFRSFEHDHAFREVEGGVALDDTIRFGMPWGVAGWMLGRFVLVPHIRGLLRRRFALLKRIAESEEWREYLGG